MSGIPWFLNPDMDKEYYVVSKYKEYVCRYWWHVEWHFKAFGSNGAMSSGSDKNVANLVTPLEALITKEEYEEYLFLWELGR